MPDCPKCRVALVRRRNDFGVFWYCPQCEGSAVTLSLLRKIVPKAAMNGLWQRVRLGAYPRKHPCPSCEKGMEQVSVEAEGRRRAIDVCNTCQLVWLDEGEWADLQFFAIESKGKVDLQAEVRAQIAAKRKARQAPPAQSAEVPKVVMPEPPSPETIQLPKIDEVGTRPPTKAERRERRPVERQRPSSRPEPMRRSVEAKRPARHSGWGGGPPQMWHWIPALLGMPVEEEQPVGRLEDQEKPWLTWTLALGITLVSLLAMFDLRAMIEAFGLVPAEYDRLGGLTWLTSFFLHGGLLHLVGNVYFLVVFGDNVEKCLGTLEFFGLLVLAAICGDFVHILIDPDSYVPCVGASGGISGVIAFYALRFPRQKLALMFWFFFKTYWWRLSAIWMFALWVIFQCIIAGQQMVGISQVSGGAHLGGALVGVIAWALWRINGGAKDREDRFAGAYLK